MSEICCYHANCVDGMFSAFAHFLSRHSQDHKYLPVTLNKKNVLEQLLKKIEKITREKNIEKIFILDCIGPEDFCLCLAKSYPKVKIIIIDHHKTSLEYLENIEIPSNMEINFNLNKSGAYLSYEYFGLPELFPEFEQVYKWVQDYDLWKFVYPQSKNFTQGCYQLKYPFLIQDDPFQLFSIFLDQNWDYILETGEKKDKEIKEKVNKSLNDAIILKIFVEALEKDIKCLAVFIASSDSDVINELGNKLAEVSEEKGLDPVGIVFRIIEQDTFRFYVRSKNGFNSSVISLQYGGGGHPCSSGFSCTREIYEQWILSE